MARPWMLVMVAFSVACGGRTDTAADDGSSSGGSEGGTSTTAGTDGDPSVCGCRMASYDDSPGCGFDEMFADVPECPSQTPCPTLTVTCPMGQPDLYDCKLMYEYDEEALACMLTAFRERTPGRYDIDGDTDYGLNTGQDKIELRIREDGMAVHTWCWSTDAGTQWTNSNLRTLAEPAYFEQCMDEASPGSRYACLVSGLSGATDLPRCQ